MSEFLNDVPKSVDEQHRGQSAAARRQRVGGAAAALGSTGMPAWANDAQAQPPTSKLDDPPNTLETIANAAATAEVLTTIVNTVGPEHVALDEQTRLNVRAAALEEKIHYEVLISDAVA